MELGVEVFERETFRSAVSLAEKALTVLGHPHAEAHRLATAFEKHDERLLRDSYELREDREAYVGFVRQSTEMLDRVMQADREAAEGKKPKPEDKAAE